MSLATEVITCQKCPRLANYCQEIALTKRKAYAQENYWGRPVPGFGDLKSRLVIVGLAPGAHGANRTGRVFTGDRSGDWLYRSLYKMGFANQPSSSRLNDGLVLHDAYVTCVVKCAPPDNKPSLTELSSCSDYLSQEIAALTRTQVWIALGRIAYDRLWPTLPRANLAIVKKPAFKHGTEIQIDLNRWLLLSYHPSQQNTFTGRLTEPMFDGIFSRVRELIC